MSIITQTVGAITPENCCGCAACMDKCPVHAITMHYDSDFNRVPLVDDKACISCGQCVKLCPRINEEDRESCENINGNINVYLGCYENKAVERNSSSGGIFAAMALQMIEQGGIVYGAAMCYENNSLSCRHIRVTEAKDIHLLQGSKYIQSRTDGIYKQVKADLKEGRMVLFSGTSCQVASLKRFVGENPNLYTVDLVCHGVPKEKLFKDYISFYESKYKCTIKNISFRSKGYFFHGKEMKHLLTLTCEKNNEVYEDKIIENKSSYYCLFMSRAGYRSSCYSCIYASPNKPADITLGDYTLTSIEAKKYQLLPTHTYSTILVHNDRGEKMLEDIKDNLILASANPNEVIARHGNLNHPSKITERGTLLYTAYLKGGYSRLQRIINFRMLKYEIYYYLTKSIKKIAISIKSKVKNVFLLKCTIISL